MIMSFARSSREEYGRPDISLSLAAAPRGTLALAQNESTVVSFLTETSMGDASDYMLRESPIYLSHRSPQHFRRQIAAQLSDCQRG